MHLIAEQLRDPDKVVEYMKENWCGNSREAQSYKVYWHLAAVSCLTLNIILRGEGGKQTIRHRGHSNQLNQRFSCS